MSSRVQTQHRRRASVVVQVMVSMTVLVGFAALTIDLGSAYRAHGELQNAADAAALAGASAFTSDLTLQSRNGANPDAAYTFSHTMLKSRVNQLSERNYTLGEPTMVDISDILTGAIDLNSADSPLDTTVATWQQHAVQVTMRRMGGDGASNGPVKYYFAPLLGMASAQAQATAVAAFDDRFAGYNVDTNGAPVIPFVVPADLFAQGVSGDGSPYDDGFGYNTADGGVDAIPDGIREFNIHGWTQDRRFGFINVGTLSVDDAAVIDQATYGVDASALAAAIGSSEFTVYDADGNPINYTFTTHPDSAFLETALATALQDHVGDVLGVLLQNGGVEADSDEDGIDSDSDSGGVDSDSDGDSVDSEDSDSDSGIDTDGDGDSDSEKVGDNDPGGDDSDADDAMSSFNITGIGFVRVMGANLTGPADSRRIWLQPVIYSGSGVVLSTTAPSSGGMIGRVRLVR
ncbi:MAG: pilus assembly protein TadG-related protein [Phycisphaerae bacterium]